MEAPQRRARLGGDRRLASHREVSRSEPPPRPDAETGSAERAHLDVASRARAAAGDSRRAQLEDVGEETGLKPARVRALREVHHAAEAARTVNVSDRLRCTPSA